MITTIGVDADDTIWHNETKCQAIYDLHHHIIHRYQPETQLSEESLLRIERKNLGHFGYGTKGLMLSAIESVLEATENRATGGEIAELLRLYHEQLATPIDLIPGVVRSLLRMRHKYKLLLITKGDVFEQNVKIESSGIKDLFDGVHIVPEKDAQTYQTILASRNVGPDQFVMIGNSLKSDVLPVIELGADAIHVPYHLTWLHEKVDDPSASTGKWTTALSFEDAERVILDREGGQSLPPVSNVGGGNE